MSNISPHLSEILLTSCIDLMASAVGLIKPDSWLASINVEALDTSIPHDLGIKAVEYFLLTRGRQYRAHSRLVLDLIEFTLTKNYFLCDDKIFHQLMGTAMGSSCAPSYANLFLG